MTGSTGSAASDSTTTSPTEGAATRASGARKALTRSVTLLVAVTFAVVGLAAPSSAHHNTISGHVSCRDGGGWDVTWRVTNSEYRWETIIESDRPSVVPVGTQLSPRADRWFSEVVTTKPTSSPTMTLKARWSNGVTARNWGSIPVSDFADGCDVRTVKAPTIPVVDECGPGNAHYGDVPTGPWSVVRNADGSVVVTASEGYVFPGGKTSITYAPPKDSNQPCPVTEVAVPTVPVVDECGPGNAHFGLVPTGPWTTVLNPDGSLTLTATEGHAFPGGLVSVTLTAPADSNEACPTDTTSSETEVLPAELRLVRAKVRRIDKCGRRADTYKVGRRSGVEYRVRGRVLQEGRWLRARSRTMIVRAHSTDETVALKGRRVWKMEFTNRRCAAPPDVSPDTGR